MDEHQSLHVMVAEGTMRSITERMVRQVEIDPAQLSVNLNLFITQMDALLSKTPESVGGFRLSEVEVSVEVSANGQVVLWGIGGQIGGKGGVSLTFKR